MSAAQRRDIANGIWLCGNCSRLVDGDEAKYTIAFLHSWKKAHEATCSETLEGKCASLDKQVIADLAGSFDLPAQLLEEQSAVPEPPTVPANIEFVVSALYSEDKSAIIVVAELGNGSANNLTVREALLTVQGTHELVPREPWAVGGLDVQGYTWLGLTPHVVSPMTLNKIAWLFDPPPALCEEMTHTQPLQCKLTVRFFPLATLVRPLDLFSISRLRDGGASKLLDVEPSETLIPSEAVLTALGRLADVHGYVSTSEKELAEVIGPVAHGWSIHAVMLDLKGQGAFSGKPYFESDGRNARFDVRLALPPSRRGRLT